MEVLYPRCAGLEVHKDEVVACVRVAEGAKVSQEVRGFATTTSGLLALAEWLLEAECTHVAMEATIVVVRHGVHLLERVARAESVARVRAALGAMRRMS